MNRQFPSQEVVARVREAYPPGCRVELLSMNDPFTKLPARRPRYGRVRGRYGYRARCLGLRLPSRSGLWRG